MPLQQAVLLVQRMLLEELNQHLPQTQPPPGEALHMQQPAAAAAMQHQPADYWGGKGTAPLAAEHTWRTDAPPPHLLTAAHQQQRVAQELQLMLQQAAAAQQLAREQPGGQVAALQRSAPPDTASPDSATLLLSLRALQHNQAHVLAEVCMHESRPETASSASIMALACPRLLKTSFLVTAGRCPGALPPHHSPAG